MKRGDYIVRFTSRQTIGAGGHRFGDDLTMSQSSFHDVMVVVHASGALEIERPASETEPKETLVIYGPGFWQSITPIVRPESRRESKAAADAYLAEQALKGGPELTDIGRANLEAEQDDEG